MFSGLYRMPLRELSDAGGDIGEETGLMSLTNELLNVKTLGSPGLCVLLLL